MATVHPFNYGQLKAIHSHMAIDLTLMSVLAQTYKQHELLESSRIHLMWAEHDLSVALKLIKGEMEATE